MPGDKRLLMNDYQVLRSAIEQMLRRNRILASYLVWDQDADYGLDSDLALHVTLKHDEKLFDHIFQHGGTVESNDELRDLAANHPHPEWTLLPGMLFRVLTYNIKQTGTLGFIYSGMFLTIAPRPCPRAHNLHSQPLHHGRNIPSQIPRRPGRGLEHISISISPTARKLQVVG
jgi:hypothetical protein